MAAFPHRIISAVAKRITASLEFRCGDTCFIASIVAKPTDRSISSAHNAVAALSYAPIHRWYQMLWGRAELILRQPESSDGAAPCNRSTPLILPSTWLLSSVHQPGSSPPASLGPRSHICIGSRAVIRPPCSLSSRRCAPVLLAASTPRLVLCAVLRQDVMGSGCPVC